MDPVSSVDRIVLLLRQKLKEREKAQRTPATGQNNKPASPVSPSALDALAAIGGVDERTLRRAFIQTLLTDQFGAQLVNDAQFQQIVVKVSDLIETDAAASRLLTRVVSGMVKT